MKLVCRLSSLEKLAHIEPYIDGILLEDSVSIVEQIKKVHEHGLIPIYRLDRLMFPLEIEEYRKKILATKELSCLYYITDLGLAHMLKAYGLISRTIYDPITMITNHLDAKEFMEYGFHALGISNEITLKDTKSIIMASDCKAFLQVFGFRLMQSSRRKLLSLYGKKIGSKIPTEDLTIKEAKRDDHYPIVEDKYETRIYRGGILHLLKELPNLPIAYAYLDGQFLDEEIFDIVIKNYAAYLKDPTQNEALAKIDQLNLKIEEGFSIKDTIYMKEAL